MQMTKTSTKKYSLSKVKNMLSWRDGGVGGVGGRAQRLRALVAPAHGEQTNIQAKHSNI